MLKKKSDALKKAFRGILQKIVEAKIRMGIDFKEASLGLASAYFAAGDISRNVVDHVKTRTNVRLNVHTETTSRPVLTCVSMSTLKTLLVLSCQSLHLEARMNSRKDLLY